jgi:LysR family transcriptional regulator, regulator for bpeEF and oprC
MASPKGGLPVKLRPSAAGRRHLSVMKNLDTLVVFVQVAESQNFSKAAEWLGMTPSGISKAISRLEDDLRVKLLNRTTRVVKLTDEGQMFFERCRAILHDVEDAEGALASAIAAPSGRLRVQMPVGFGTNVVLPRLPKFLEQNPDLTLDLELSDRIADLAYDGLDATIVLGPQRDSSLVSVKLYQTRLVSVASPDYIRRYGEPKTPDDLDQHKCLGHYESRSGAYRALDLKKDGTSYSKALFGRLNINHAPSLIEMAIAGLGIARAATFMAEEAVKAKKLKIVLKDYVGVGPEISLLYLPARHYSPRVRAFTQFISKIVPRKPSWDDILH